MSLNYYDCLENLTENFKSLMENLDESTTKKKKSSFKYFLIFDVEATIEFPVVLLEAETNQIIDTFHRYCKPTINPVLTDFCKELTGIQQNFIDDSSTFGRVLEEFENWILKYSKFPFKDIVFVTDGPWDIKNFVQDQLKILDLTIPVYFKYWINIRNLFQNSYKKKSVKISTMLKFLDMEFEGRPHSGIDDAKNIARIFQRIINDGYSIKALQCLDGNYIKVGDRNKIK
ncbi:3'-5' exoribonuclease 1 [Lobulomyces angularis]|nr:3'-5' exoribonuclease 1 [Lobulomyces angularis]